jgi:PAS domain S-box-containing protein
MDLEHQEYEKYIEILNQVAIVSKTDTAGNITYVNDYFEEVSGYTNAELIGQPHNIIRHEEVSPDIFKKLWETIQDGKRWEGKLKNKAKDGSYYITVATVYPIFDDNESDTRKITEYMSVRFLVTKEQDNQAQFRDKVGKSMIKFKVKIKETTSNIKELNHLLLKKDANKKYIDEKYKETISKYKEGIYVLKDKHIQTTHKIREVKSRNQHLENNLDLIIKNKLDAKDRIIKDKEQQIKKEQDKIKELNELLNSFKDTIQELKKKLENANDKKYELEKALDGAIKQSKKRLDLINNLEEELAKNK